MTAFESMTALDQNELNNHAISIAASEYAVESDEIGTQASRIQIAHNLRRMEEAETNDGRVVPALVELRQRVDVQDDYEGQTNKR